MNCSVLVVDDSLLLRKTVRRAVEQCGVPSDSIREAGNGKEALDALAQAPADLVLLDLNMPVMTGFEFAEHIHGKPEFAGMTVVAVTTEGNQERLNQLRGHGVKDFLRKPFEPEVLRDIIEAAGA